MNQSGQNVTVEHLTPYIMEDLAITLQFFLNCVTKVFGRFGSLLLSLWFDLQMLLDLERGAMTQNVRLLL